MELMEMASSFISSANDDDNNKPSNECLNSQEALSVIHFKLFFLSRLCMTLVHWGTEYIPSPEEMYSWKYNSEI